MSASKIATTVFCGLIASVGAEAMKDDKESQNGHTKHGNPRLLECPVSVSQTWKQLRKISDDVILEIHNSQTAQQRRWFTTKFWVVQKAWDAINPIVMEEKNRFKNLRDPSTTAQRAATKIVYDNYIGNYLKTGEELPYPYAALVRIAVGQKWINTNTVARLKWGDTTIQEPWRAQNYQYDDEEELQKHVNEVIKESAIPAERRGSRQREALFSKDKKVASLI